MLVAACTLVELVVLVLAGWRLAAAQCIVVCAVRAVSIVAGVASAPL